GTNGTNGLPGAPDVALEEDLGEIKTGLDGAGSIHWGFALILALLVMLRRKSAALIVASMVLASGSANAEWTDEANIYVGAGIGQSRLNPDIENSSYTIDENSQLAWKLTGGLDLNDYISIEGFYSDLGNVKLDPDGEIRYQMFGANGLLHIWAYGDEREKGSIALYAKAGVNHMTNDSSDVGYDKINTTQLMGGIGVEAYFKNKFSVRLEIESYDTDASLISLNLVKRFGFKSKKVEQKELIDMVDSMVSLNLANRYRLESEQVAQKEFVTMVDSLPETASGPGVVMLAAVVIDSDLDGLLDDDDECPNTPKGMKVDNVGCATFIGDVSNLISNVQFETDSSIITEPSKVVLNNVADLLLSHTTIDVEVQAHTDNMGSAVHNKSLSQSRAKSVVKYLTEKSIAEFRFKLFGFGEEKPIADNNTKAGRAINRRVEFKLKQR
ncbi:MAG: OOP family OmpA-OmpF porin, partial [Oleispira sp.]